MEKSGHLRCGAKEIYNSRNKGKFDSLSDHKKPTFRLSLPFLWDPSRLVSAAAKLRLKVNTNQAWGQTWSWWVIRIGEEQSSSSFLIEIVGSQQTNSKGKNFDMAFLI